MLEAGDFCKFNSLDGRSVDAMLIRTDIQKVAERLRCDLIFRSTVAQRAEKPSKAGARGESLFFFWHTSLHRQSNLAVFGFLALPECLLANIRDENDVHVFVASRKNLTVKNIRTANLV